MIEIIDVNSKKKLLGMIIASIKYMDDNYIIYAIDRGRGEVNIFVSKLVKMSEGLTFNNNFLNGEKEFVEKVIKRIINKEDIVSDGFVISSAEDLSEVNYFDIEACYVATVEKKIIKEMMIFYKLVTEKTIDRPNVKVVEDERFFNEGYIGNIFLIVLGLVVVFFSLWVIVGVFK